MMSKSITFNKEVTQGNGLSATVFVIALCAIIKVDRKGMILDKTT